MNSNDGALNVHYDPVVPLYNLGNPKCKAE